jgi:hypothetical protein
MSAQIIDLRVLNIFPLIYDFYKIFGQILVAQILEENCHFLFEKFDFINFLLIETLCASNQ